MKNNKILAGKVALVTGGSRGIGRAIVLALAEAGAQVVINYAGNEVKALEVLEQVKELGSDGYIMKADVGNAEEVDAMIKEIMDKYKKIDILVNNAGIVRDTLLIRMKDDDWQKVIQTNLTGAFNCVRAVARPMMKQRVGKIINISSVVGLTGNVSQVNYSAAKAGLIGLTKSTAKELASRNINVNAVAPGYIKTDMTDELPESVKDEIQARIPLNRLGNPDDVAQLVLFLAGPTADYITGQVISVDGGMRI